MNASDYVSGANKATKATNEITGAAAKTESGARRLAAQYGGLAKAVAGAFVARAAVNFAKDSVAAFSNLEESINAVNVSFGAGAGAIKDFGTTAATQVGLSNAAFNQMSVTTGALLSNFITDEKQAAAETIKLTKRAADMASVFNTSVPDALNAVQAAIRGEMEPARRFGVMLDDMTIRTHAVEMGLAGSTKEVDKQAKGLAALDLIYQQTNKTAGDFANTSDGLANKQRILAAKFEDTKAKVGESFAPVLDTLLDSADKLLPALEALGPALGDLVGGFASLVSAAGPLIEIMAGAATATGALMSTIADGNLDAARFVKAQNAIADAANDGGDQAAAFANALTYLAQEEELTTEKLNALAAATEFHGEQQGVAIGLAYESAQAHGADAASVKVLEDALIKQIAATGRSADEQQDLIDKYGVSAMLINGVATSTDGLGTAYEDAGRLGRTYADTVADVALSQEDAEAATEEATAAIRDQIQAHIEAANPTIRAIKAAERLRDAQDKLTKAQQDGAATADDIAGAMLGVIEAQGDLESANAGLIGTSKESFEAFRDLGRRAGLTEDAINELARSIGALPSSKSIGINVKTSYSTSGSPPPVPPSYTPTGTTTFIPKYAEGGDYAANQPIMVGELGPEILIPTSAGSIIPNNQVGGGGVTNIYMEGRGDVYDDVSLALAMSGITEAIEWSGTSTLR